jgi:hypothetical protein
MSLLNQRISRLITLAENEKVRSEEGGGERKGKIPIME